jgi:GAF domain-containing protein
MNVEPLWYRFQLQREGVLCWNSPLRRSDSPAPSAHETQLLTSLADQIGVAVENA